VVVMLRDIEVQPDPCSSRRCKKIMRLIGSIDSNSSK
jgi:hypothetical protein